MKIEDIIKQSEKKANYSPFYLIAIILVTCLAIFIIWKIPIIQIHGMGLEQKQRFDAENEARKTTVQLLGGSLIIIGLYFTWRRLKASEEGQITDRFTKAVEQLGDRNRIEVRLGGIYALERIARDSEKDYWTIIELLASFIRENSPWNKDKISPEIPAEFLPPRNVHWDKFIDEIFSRPQPNIDIQVAITAIGNIRDIHKESNQQFVNLIGTNLSGVVMRNMDLRKSRLWGSNLQFADFTGSNLELSNLYGCNLTEATLIDANLKTCVLSNADLRKVKAINTNFENANLIGAKLEGATLWGAIMVKSQVSWADFTNASMKEANLNNSRANNAIFKNANLISVSFENANLQSADFTEANLEDANLKDAKVRYARFVDAKGLPEQSINV